MKIAIIGCGYVADFYARNLRSHPDFEVIGCFDIDADRLEAFCSHYKFAKLASLEAAINDPRVEMVFNLTNPRSHFTVSQAIIRAGKHLYTEKPMGMDFSEAQQILAMANEAGVRVGSAPCNMLNETTQELKKALRAGSIGKVRLAYANYDDGMIAPHERPWNWLSEAGAPWPAKDEFEVGCTYEHAGYYLTVLAELFGPAKAVTAFSSTQIPDKGIAVDMMAPDFSVGCVEYADGIVARVTAGLVAPSDKSLMVVGDEGVLLVRHLRNDREEILIESHSGIFSKMRKAAARLGISVGDFGLYRRFLKPTGPNFVHAARNKPVDFMRGPQDMADAVRENRAHRLSGELAVHIVEMTEMLQFPERHGYHLELRSRF